MNSREEREDFSRRLRVALNGRSLSTSPSALTRLFNAHSPHQNISVIGVRKWMVGASIPSPAKMDVLAEITGVHSAWLRYGEGPRNTLPDTTKLPSLEGLRWAVDLSYLTSTELELVKEFVKKLLNLQVASDSAYKSTTSE